MPYVKQGTRTYLEDSPAENSGDLSYKISCVILEYLQGRELSWNDAIAHVFAALDGAELAFKIEVAEPYEKRKLAQNGAIYGDIFHGNTPISENKPKL
jgi:hypothetical protein